MNLPFFIISSLALMLVNEQNVYSSTDTDLSEDESSSLLTTVSSVSNDAEINGWVESIDSGTTKVDKFSFGSKLIKVIKNRENNNYLFQKIIKQLSEKRKAIRREAPGGYLVEYYPEIKEVNFNPYAGSKAK